MLSQMLQKVAVLSYLEGSCIVNNTRLESRESNLYIGSSIFNDDIILSGDNSPGDATHHGRNKARDERRSPEIEGRTAGAATGNQSHSERTSGDPGKVQK